MHARDALVARLWQQAEPETFFTEAEFAHNLDGWSVVPVEIDGTLAFIFVHRGPEFHFASLGGGAQISRRMIVHFLGPIIAEHGHAMTRTPASDQRQQRFNVAFGFVAHARDPFWVHYRIDATTWTRRHACRFSP